MSRTIAIGDVHGQSSNLSKLLIKIAPLQEDTIVFLGDIVDRGNTHKVIEQVLTLAEFCHVVPILGNHEEMMMLAPYSFRWYNMWMRSGGDKTKESYYGGKVIGEHYRFLAGMVEYYETEEHIFTHAAYDPNKDPSDWSAADKRWNFYDPKRPPHKSGKTIICGHTPKKSIRRSEGCICIDSGCGMLPKGVLTAFDVHSGTIWQE